MEPVIRLRKIIEKIPDVEVKGSQDVAITGVCAHSKMVAPGNLFVAKKGRDDDGSRYSKDAVDAGAVAILTDLYDPFLPVTQIIHPNVRKMEAAIAAVYFHHPASRLNMIGITGTNGKTTTSYLARTILEKGGIPTGMIGTIEWIVGSHRFEEPLTTPDVITAHKLLKEMVAVGCSAAIVEVTSHGLVQGRVGEIDFDIALFTNFSQDHLDYHETMDAYLKAKALLFTGLGKDKIAIFNADESACEKIETAAKIFTYGIDRPADLQAKEIEFSKKSVRFLACYQGKEVLCSAPFVGKCNVYNILGALAIGIASGVSLETGAKALQRHKVVPGRLERVKNSQGLSVTIDFAHTPAALKQALDALQGDKRVVLFGCGGKRDRGKRAQMGAVAAEHADHVILTNDNPRSENPESIARDILQGIPKETLVEIELDRRKAIARGIEIVREGGHLLIAGKGHEKEQIFSHHVEPFSDREVVESILDEKESSCASP